MRFLVHTSRDRMFGLSLRGEGQPQDAPLPSAVRTTLVKALASPFKALDACAVATRKGTAHQAA
eukprot:5147688-Pleurochrysis_carterae.AAC.1